MGGSARVQVLILDFDGVVVESNDVKTHAFERLFGQFPEHAEAMMSFHFANVSLGRQDKFDHLLELMGKSGDRMLRDRISAEFSTYVLEGMMSAPLVEGAEAFLSQSSRRVPVYLASVTPADELDLILRRRDLARWFRGVYGCPPWTKPSAIQDLLAREGVKPADALLVGDSASDQRSAEEAGVSFVGRDSGLRFEKPPPLCFPDMTAVARFLERMLP